MYRFGIIYFLIGMVIFLASCSDDKPADTVSETQSPETEENIELSPEIQKILAPGEGTFRGVNLGMTREEVKSKEDSLELVNETPEMLVYQLTYSPNQDADFEYTFDNSGRLVKIQANIYPTSQEEQKKAFNELSSYYYSKYGEPFAQDENMIHWKSVLGEHELILKKQGNVKVHDISIEINPIVNTPSAVS